MQLDEMRAKIIEDFTKVWEVNDKAHHVDHFTRVEICGNEINDRLGLGFDPKLIMLVAHFHDMFAWSRENHHQLSAFWVRTTDYPPVAELTTEEKLMVYFGCFQHRASFEGVFKNKFAELMNAADRELPGDVDLMVDRAVLYRTGKGLSRDAVLGDAIKHIKHKFGSGGYARYPKFYIDAFGNELEEQRRIIDSL